MTEYKPAFPSGTSTITIRAERVERAEGLVWRYDVGSYRGVTRFGADDLLEQFTEARDAELYGRVCELARQGFVVHLSPAGAYSAHTPDADSSLGCIPCGFFGDEFTNLPDDDGVGVECCQECFRLTGEGEEHAEDCASGFTASRLLEELS